VNKNEFRIKLDTNSIMPSCVVVLVGGANAELKSNFYELFTNRSANGKTNIQTTVNTIPPVVLIDTPALLQNRDSSDYSWEGIFSIADIIVNFGDWSPNEIYGVRPSFSNSPLFLTWSGDHHETMKRIIDIVQRG
jgi:hypothetical protein